MTNSAPRGQGRKAFFSTRVAPCERTGQPAMPSASRAPWRTQVRREKQAAHAGAAMACSGLVRNASPPGAWGKPLSTRHGQTRNNRDAYAGTSRPGERCVEQRRAKGKRSWRRLSPREERPPFPPRGRSGSPASGARNGTRRDRTKRRRPATAEGGGQQ